MEDLNQEIQQETVDAIANLATNIRLSKAISTVYQRLVKIMEGGGKLQAKNAGGGHSGECKGPKTRVPLLLFLFWL